jgi:hypothetical protein
MSEKDYHNAIVGNLTNAGFETILLNNSISKIHVKNVNISSIITNIENDEISSSPIFTLETSYNKLENIYVNDNNLNYADISGVLYNKDKNKLVRYPPASKIHYKDILTRNSSISSIDNYAFHGIPQIHDLIFSSSLTQIGINAFSNIPTLNSIGFLYGTSLELLQLGTDCFADICENLIVFREYIESSLNFIDSSITNTNQTNINYINIDQYFVDVIDVVNVYVDGAGHLHPDIVTYNSFLQDTGHNFGIIFADDNARNRFLNGYKISNNDFISDVSGKYLHAHQDLFADEIELNDINNLTGFTDGEHTGGENYHLIRYVRGIYMNSSTFTYNINLTPEKGEDDSAILILYDGITAQYKNISGTTQDISFNVTANKFYIKILIYYEYRDGQKLTASHNQTKPFYNYLDFHFYS